MDSRSSHPSGTNTLAELRQVSKRYGSTLVLDSLSLEVPAGHHMVLLGPSGCGKSTLLRLIAGLETPDSGQVFVQDRLASSGSGLVIPPHERGISMVFQDLGLWPNLSVLENVKLGLAGVNMLRPERQDRARSALVACRIEGLADRKPNELSGGQQQRTALARALAVHPRFLLLDEPFGGLDLELKRHLCEEILRLSVAFDVTVLLVSHDPLEARAFCSHAAVLEEGRISETGALDRLLRNPASRTLREFAAQLPPQTH